MPSNSRVSGKKLALFLGDPPEAMWGDLTSCTIESAEPDNPSFGDIANGTAQFTIKGTFKQDTGKSSLWTYAWANSGQTVEFDYRPHGDAPIDEDHPRFTGTVQLGFKPSIGGDANSEGTTDFEWSVIGDVEEIMTDDGTPDPGF